MKMFLYIITCLIPNIRHLTILCDFEKASMLLFKQGSNSVIQSCLFHIGYSFIGHVIEYGLENVSITFRKLFNLLKFAYVFL